MSLHRKDDFVMPVDVEIKFDNGEKVREHWDGQGRWIRFSYQKKAKIVSAELDPDHTVQIDRNEFQQQLHRRTERKAGTQSIELLVVSNPVGQPGLELVGCVKAAHTGHQIVCTSFLQKCSFIAQYRLTGWIEGNYA